MWADYADNFKLENENGKEANVYFRNFWGSDKKEQLLNSLKNSDSLNSYEARHPNKSNLYSFRYETKSSNYNDWISFNELALLPPFQGLDEDRKFDLIDLDENELSNKIKLYFDKGNSLEQLKNTLPGLSTNSADFDAEKARRKILKEENFNSKNLKRYTVRAYDHRTCYYSTVNPLWKRARPELSMQLFEGNKFLLCRKSTSAASEGVPFYFTTSLFARDGIKGHAVAIPFMIKEGTSQQKTLSIFADSIKDNISKKVSNYLTNINEKNCQKVWYHVLSIGFSTKYLEENALNIKLGYPKIPFPNSVEFLNESSNIGEQIAKLLNSEVNIEEITLNYSDLNKEIAVISTTTNSTISSDELTLNANWGNKTVQGVMPGKGKYEERVFSKEEYKIFKASGYSEQLIHQLLGETTFDVFLNDHVFWKNIPSKVWNYHIGGYQVIKKWLSYREVSIIKRPLKKDEVREIVNTSRRIMALCLMKQELDSNYEKIKENAYQWSEKY